MTDTISIIDFIHMIKKRWKLIFCFVIFSIFGGLFITKFLLQPSYQAYSQILVNQNLSPNRSIDPTQLRSNVDLINTYSVLIKSPIVLEQVISELNLSQTPEQLNRQITIDNHDYSFIFTITVEDKKAEMAVNITNEISKVFQQVSKELFNLDNVSVLTKADLNKNVKEIVPNIKFNLIISVLIGLFASIAVSFLLEMFDNTLKDSADVENSLNLPVLGTIQKITPSKINLFNER